MDVDEIFEGATAPPWFRAFAESPIEALGDLLIGCADLGALQPAEPTDILLDWLEAYGDKSGFAEAVDQTLAQWIADSWGEPVLAVPGASAVLTPVAWCRAADIVRVDVRMTTAAAALWKRVPKERYFLDALNAGRSRDPLGRAWLALARHQQDRSFVDEWWRLCSMPPNVPWYRGPHGVRGLMGLPASDAREEGKFRSEVPEGLLKLGEGLARYEKEKWLDEGFGKDEFQRAVRMTTAAYPFTEKWSAFWSQVAAASHGLPEDWLAPFISDEPSEEVRRPRSRPEPNWKGRIRGIAARLVKQEEEAIADAKRLLAEQTAYARATGDTEFVVKSSCNFASKVKRSRPELALAWSEEARSFEPWNAFTWTTSAECLRVLERLPEALHLGLKAVERFPYDAVARNGLAETLRQAEMLDEAEAVYSETMELFPKNEVTRTGLAETLRQAERLDEAEAVYRETMDLFPNNAHARTGLAETLRQADKLGEAEAVYRETIELFPKDAYPRTGLRVVLYEMAEKEAGREKPAPYQEPEPATVDLSSSDAVDDIVQGLRLTDVEVLLTDVHLLRRWGRHTRKPETARETATELLERLRNASQSDPRVVAEQGLLLAEDEIEDAVALLREAHDLFSGSERVAYALARVERELAQRQDAVLSEETRHRVLGPWRKLMNSAVPLRPLAHLGEARGYAALTDGAVADEGLRDALGHLGRWVSRHVEPDEEPETDEDEFAVWWANAVQQMVFGDKTVRKAEDIDDLDDLRERLASNSTELDAREGDYLLRIAAS